jgi:catechol 2,3-dioxygenase-like lactoylglutathione lyase family enzyme
MIRTVWSITLYVTDLKKSARFYEETLGLEKKYEFSSYVGFECGGLEIGLIPTPEGKFQKSGTSPSIQFLVDDVNRTYSELKRKGVKFIKELHDETWGGKQATFTDPDENVLEIGQIDWHRYFEVSAKGTKRKCEAR